MNKRLGDLSKDQVTVFGAIEILYRHGVISTPAYWYENYTKIKYLDQLMINMANNMANKLGAL